MIDPLLQRCAELYGVDPASILPLAGGNYSQVFGFTRDPQQCVLRVAPPDSEIDLPGLRSILDWMAYLACHEAAVSRALVSTNDRVIEAVEMEPGKPYLVVAFERAAGLLAQELPLERWSDALLHSLGRSVGRMHALARAYRPPAGVQPRPDWEGSGNCFTSLNVLDETQSLVAQRKSAVLAEIRELPRDPEGYGLIHTDLHFANFFVDPVNLAITFFDFDDCAYGWYAMDLAMLLFDALVLYPDQDRTEFATWFMHNLLSGYLPESQLPYFWIEQLPRFLKLVEIGVYTDLYRTFDPMGDDFWVSAFMPGRKELIEAGVPYVDLDFKKLAVG